ncbi:hypothetical protein QL285_071942 [Trifolium repens]|nr:hypothetical protein QL285_071942 [Trifolium repens]
MLSSEGRSCSPEVILQIGSPDCSGSSLMAFLLSLSSSPMVPVFPNHFCKQPFYSFASCGSFSQMILLTIDFLVAAFSFAICYVSYHFRSFPVRMLSLIFAVANLCNPQLLSTCLHAL